MAMGIVQMVLLVAVVLVLVTQGVLQQVADQTMVEGVSVEVADAALFHELSHVAGLPLVEAHAGDFLLRRRSRPAWTVAGAVLLFPVGLVLLLFTDDRHVQVHVTPQPDGCRLRVVGRARRRDVERVGLAIQRVLPVAVDVGR